MTKPLGIFLDSEEPIEKVAEHIEAVLGIKFEVVSLGRNVLYRFQDGQKWIELSRHSLVNAPDVDGNEINFERYSYDMEVGIYNVEVPENYTRIRLDYAWSIFNSLKATKKYQIVLVDNLQLKLDEFSPP